MTTLTKERIFTLYTNFYLDVFVCLKIELFENEFQLLKNIYIQVLIIFFFF